MADPVYVSEVRIRRLEGRLRSAALPAEDTPVFFGVHGQIAEHYGADMTQEESHAATLDYVVAAAGG